MGMLDNESVLGGWQVECLAVRAGAEVGHVALQSDRVPLRLCRVATGLGSEAHRGQ